MSSFDHVRVVELAKRLRIKPNELRRLAKQLGIKSLPEKSYRKEFLNVDAQTLFLIVSLLEQGEPVGFMKFILPQLRDCASQMSRNSQLIVRILDDEPPLNLEGQRLPPIVPCGSTETRIYLAPLRRAFQSAMQESCREQ